MLCVDQGREGSVGAIVPAAGSRFAPGILGSCDDFEILTL